MISNFNDGNRKEAMKMLAIIIIVFLFIAWLCTPPGNKLLQICFWGNNTQMFISKLINKDNSEYLFHRNNAIYLAKMYPNGNKQAIIEMNKAIALYPSYAPESELQRLYAERAQINMYMGNYQQALSDYMNSGQIMFNDYLKVALLYKIKGDYARAMSYCNAILDTDAKAYAGFACLASVYEGVGRPDMALRVWDLAIDRKKSNPKCYVSRAIMAKKLGNMERYKKDIAKARELSPSINIDENVIDEVLNPKILTISIR